MKTKYVIVTDNGIPRVGNVIDCQVPSGLWYTESLAEAEKKVNELLQQTKVSAM